MAKPRHGDALNRFFSTTRCGHSIGFGLAYGVLTGGLIACHSEVPDTASECPSTPALQPLATGGGMCIAKDLSGVSDRQATTDPMAELGAISVRSDLHWHQVQPTEDTWDWSIPDDILNSTERSGLEFIPMLGYGVAWASSQTEDDPYYPPDDPADFATFAGAVAQRYQGRIHRYEIWNEPNAGYRFWKPEVSGDPEGYGALFLAAEEAIHAADPTAEVILGGTFFHEQIIPGTLSFTEEMLNAFPEILTRADAIAVHPYTRYPPRVAPENDEDDEVPIWEMLSGVRALTGELPILITEMGWPSWSPVTEADQAAWLTRGTLLAQASGAEVLCWYTLRDEDEPSNTEESFGLLRSDDSRKPSGEAFAALARRSVSATGVGEVQDLPEGAWGVSYGESGTAYWGEGEVCGETLGPEPIWIESP